MTREKEFHYRESQIIGLFGFYEIYVEKERGWEKEEKIRREKRFFSYFSFLQRRERERKSSVSSSARRFTDPKVEWKIHIERERERTKDSYKEGENERYI